MGKKDPEPQTGKGGAFKETVLGERPRILGHAPSVAGLPELSHVIQAAVVGGAYFSMGHTADGGALLIRVLDNGRKLETYCSSRSELLEALAALAARFADTMPTMDLADQAGA